MHFSTALTGEAKIWFNLVNSAQ